MVTRAALYGISTKRAARQFQAHVKAARDRLDRIELAMNAGDEDPAATAIVDSFRKDVERWERELKDWLQYFDEEID